jgi:hypothetical protein
MVPGSGISLFGTNTVAIGDPGYYMVSYFLVGDTISGELPLVASLSLNGDTVPGSIIQEAGAVDTNIENSVSNTILVNVTQSNSALTLVNSSAETIVRPTLITDGTSASITLTRIS